MKKYLILFLLTTLSFQVDAQTLKGKFLLEGSYESGVYTETVRRGVGGAFAQRETSAGYGSFSVGYFSGENTLLRLEYFRLRLNRKDNQLFSTFTSVDAEWANYLSLQLRQQVGKGKFRFFFNSKLVGGKTKQEVRNSSFNENSRANKMNFGLYGGLGFANFFRNGQSFEYGIDLRLWGSDVAFSSRKLRANTLISIYFRPTIVYNPQASQQKYNHYYPLVPQSQFIVRTELGKAASLEILSFHNLFNNFLRIGYGYSISEEIHHGFRSQTPLWDRGFWLLFTELNFVESYKERKLLPYLRLRYEAKIENFDLIDPFYSMGNTQRLSLQAVHANKNSPLRVYYGLGLEKYRFDELDLSFSFERERLVYRQLVMEMGLEYYLNPNFSLRYDILTPWYRIDKSVPSFQTSIFDISTQFSLNIYLLNKRSRRVFTVFD